MGRSHRTRRAKNLNIFTLNGSRLLSRLCYKAHSRVYRKVYTHTNVIYLRHIES